MRIPNIKTVKIGDQTFELGKVYPNPFVNAFKKINEEKPSDYINKKDKNGSK